MGIGDAIFAALALGVQLALAAMIWGVLFKLLGRFLASIAAIVYAGIIAAEWGCSTDKKQYTWFNYPDGEDNRVLTDLVASAALLFGIMAMLTITGLNASAQKAYLAGTSSDTKFFVIGFWVFMAILLLIFKTTEPDSTEPLAKLRKLPLPFLIDSIFKSPE